MAHTLVKNTGVFKPGVNGGIFRYPLGTTVSTNPSAARPSVANWDPRIGGCDEDGMILSTSRDQEKKRDWNGDKVRAIQTGKDDTVKFKLIEPKSVAAKKLIFGDPNVVVTAATVSSGTLIETKSNSDMLEHFTFVADTLDGSDRVRTIFPDAQISEIGDIIYQSKDWTVYEVTLELFPDLAGNTWYEYTELDDKLVTTNVTVTITGTPTGGTFTLTVGGQTTTAIVYNAATSAVKSALEALSTVGAGNATVTGSAGGPYSVALVTAGVATVSADGSGLTGGTSPGVTVS
ncbi:hypothetical protein ACLQ3K_20080 [Tsukamurella sp. DT100]|uniref:phage tail tube protein n=1 Tax=Tsukamurella sp. DT100 TaxID=3393415 RepID=UPI003CF1899D